MPFERKFSADKMLLNEFCLKSFRFLVIASDLQMGNSLLDQHEKGKKGTTPSQF